MNKPHQVLCCRNLHKTFSEGDLHVPVLRGVDLTVEKGQQIAIVGTSGSGKSTLLHLLGGLDQPTQGSVTILGQALAKLSETARGHLRNQSLGFVYQFHHLLPEFSAVENVAMPLLIRGLATAKAMTQATEFLQQVGLQERLQHKPSELSGGERQRAAVARALVTRPACLLADEPTGNLDRKSAEQVFERLLELNSNTGTSILMVTHDMRLAERMDRIVYLEDGVLRS